MVKLNYAQLHIIHGMAKLRGTACKVEVEDTNLKDVVFLRLTAQRKKEEFLVDKAGQRLPLIKKRKSVQK